MVIKKIDTHLRLDEGQYEALHRVCLLKKISKNSAMLRAVEAWIEAEKAGDPAPPPAPSNQNEQRQVDLYLNFLRHGDASVVETIQAAVEGHVQAFREKPRGKAKGE